jgi:hypothetical protein
VDTLISQTLIDIIGLYESLGDAAKRLDEDEKVFEESHQFDKEVQYVAFAPRIPFLSSWAQYILEYYSSGKFVFQATSEFS